MKSRSIKKSMMELSPSFKAKCSTKIGKDIKT